MGFESEIDDERARHRDDGEPVVMRDLRILLRKIGERHDEHEARISVLEQSNKEAFPHGDVLHAQDHIEIETNKKLWRSMKTEIIKYIILGVITASGLIAYIGGIFKK